MAYCILMGLVHVLNVHPAGDGLWFWYARMTRSGSLLYTDLHFPLQPLFVLLTGWFQAVFGQGWLAGKILPVLQLVAYVATLRLIVAQAPIGDRARGLLLAGVFFLTMASPFYRFDDYHITSDLLTAIALYLLLRVGETRSTPRLLANAAAVGACCGLSLANRLNDGATLLAGCVIALVIVTNRARLAAVATCVTTAVACLLMVVLATGDTVHAWATESIVRAAAIKGGTGNVLEYPLELPWHLLQGMAGWRAPALLAYLILFAVLMRYLTVRRKAVPAQAFWNAGRSAAVLVALVCLGVFVRQSRAGTTVYFFTVAAALAVYFGGIVVAYRVVKQLAGKPVSGWTGREVLLLLPLGQLVAGAMTSAHTLPDLFPPVAFTLLLLPVALSDERRRRWLQWLLATCAGVVLSVTIAKVTHPYFWHFYNSGPIFQGRQWYEHPLYGPMYIDTTQLKMVRGMCDAIAASPEPRSLLAMPYPYPNYFCGIVPWKGYVQTWYDTAGRTTIETLTAQLEAAPPQWIAYENDAGVLRVHEKTFNQGRPLPHRQVDRLIHDKLVTNAWTLTQRSCLNGSHWMLIHTVPATQPSPVQQSYRDNPRSFCTKDLDDAPGY